MLVKAEKDGYACMLCDGARRGRCRAGAGPRGLEVRVDNGKESRAAVRSDRIVGLARGDLTRDPWGPTLRRLQT